ncbi:MAG: AmmeMemoRadiSam system protein B [Deltaproteobacteria bacterium]|nr:AmmeMemoRadiSam system protein B [Deltaproteobacteria bacterium]
MGTRGRSLPYGWYPDTASACRQEIEEFISQVEAPGPDMSGLNGGIVPHAGWYFSGKAAAKVFRYVSHEGGVDIVAVFGGHMSAEPGLIYLDEAWETPLGNLEIDQDLGQALKDKADLEVETWETGDNTMEVQLPFIKYFFPDSRIVAIRAPHSQKAVNIGQQLIELAKTQGQTIRVFGSTDLTHYGPNYGFTPQGRGQAALDWMRNENDKGFIDLALAMNLPGLLEHAAQNHSACSAGAAAAAIAACQALGSNRGELLDYYTSSDIMPGDSFVGYAGIVF